MSTPNLQSDDYYAILGCPRGASDAQLKKAYRKLAVKWHPDKNPNNEQATKYFQKISEAYAILSDEKKRKLYDQYGKQGVEAAEQGADPGASPFGGMGGMPGGMHFSTGGPGGGGHMDAQQAQFLFSQFFGNSDPFGGMGGSMGGGSPFGNIGMSHMGGDPFSSMGGMGGMGGSGRRRRSARPPQPKRYDAISAGTVVSLQGLVGSADRNGDRGTIREYDASSRRYTVEMEDDQAVLRVKAENVLQHASVTLTGLETHPDWNGKTGTVLAYDAVTERYNVYISADRKVLSLKPANCVLKNGVVAKIVGLVSKPQLNGQFGTIKQWDRTTGRYDVQLSADQILRLKLDNLRV